MSLDSILAAGEIGTLRAALDRMIPADDYPGAWEGGVGEYLSRQLGSDLAGGAGAYRAGLAGLESEAWARCGARFEELEPAQQDAILESASGEAGAFVEMMAGQAAEGYYGDPGNGGNRDCASWKMVGFDPRWSVTQDGDDRG